MVQSEIRRAKVNPMREELLLADRKQSYRDFLENLPGSALIHRLRGLFDREELLRFIVDVDPTGEEDPEFEEIWRDF